MQDLTMEGYWGANVLLGFVICLVFSIQVIPQIILISLKKRLFDVPDERKVHSGVVPRLGGVAFAPIVMFSSMLVAGLNFIFEGDKFGFDTVALAQYMMLFCSVIMLYLVGVADDLVGVPYKVKFVIQISSGLLMVASGVVINSFDGLFGIGDIPMWFGWMVTIFLSVFIVNAINLIDGLDGLASGISASALIYYGIVFFVVEDYFASILAFSVLGVLIPFFYYNVFGDAAHYRKIFMGDTGALTIGFILCFLGVRLSDASMNEFVNDENSLALAFSPMLIPCMDVVRVFMGRMRRGNNPFLPDKSHIHHKLLRIGFSHRVAMITIVVGCITITTANALLSHYININIILFSDIAMWVLLNMWLSSKIKERESKLEINK